MPPASSRFTIRSGHATNTLLVLAGVIAFGTPATLPSPLAAASAGSRVRVKAPTVQKRPIVGTLLSPITDSVKIEVYMGRAADARRRAIPVSSIETLEGSMGRSSAAGRALGVKAGALLALGVGATFGVAFAVDGASASRDSGSGENNVGPPPGL